MSIILKFFDKCQTSRQVGGNGADRLALSLLKEYSKPLDVSQLYQISLVISQLPIASKVNAVFAVVSLLKVKFEEKSDEDYYLEIKNVLTQLICKILNFFVERSNSLTFNTHEEVFSKTVETALTLFIPLRKKSHDLGFSFMKACSVQVLTLLTCKRLLFSVRRAATIAYAEEVAECDRKFVKRIAQTQSSLLSDLVQWVPQCGDIQLQEALVEIAVYHAATTAEKTSLIKKWLSRSEYDPAIDNLSFHNLSTSLRLCLNYINSLTKPKKVFTLACQRCFGDNHTPINKPKDEGYKELWVDFNTSTKSINLIHTPDSTQQGWHRLVLYFDNIRSLDCSPLKSLIKNDVDEFQLHLSFKECVPVMTLDQPQEFSCLTLIFISGPLLEELVNEFLVSHFPNLKNSTNMKGFKTQDPAKTHSNTPISLHSGAKNYFSRKSVVSAHSEPNNFVLNCNDYLKKYLNITSEQKNQSLNKFHKPESMFSLSGDSMAGNSFAAVGCLESKNVSSTRKSSSFVTEYAKIKTDNFKIKTSTLNDSWKSNCSMLKDLSESSLRIRQEGGGVERISNSNYDHHLSDSDNVKSNSILKLHVSDDLNYEKIDMSILPDLNSDDDVYGSELRSTSVREMSPIYFGTSSVIPDENCKKATNIQSNGLLSLIGEDTDNSNQSDCRPQIPSISIVKRFAEDLKNIPIPDYESDDSIIEDSQGQVTEKTPLKLIGERYKNICENFLSDEMPVNVSPPLSHSDEDLFVTNKNKYLTKFVDDQNLNQSSVRRSCNKTIGKDEKGGCKPGSSQNNVKLFKTTEAPFSELTCSQYSQTADRNKSADDCKASKKPMLKNHKERAAASKDNLHKSISELNANLNMVNSTAESSFNIVQHAGNLKKSSLIFSDMNIVEMGEVVCEELSSQMVKEKSNSIRKIPTKLLTKGTAVVSDLVACDSHKESSGLQSLAMNYSEVSCIEESSVNYCQSNSPRTVDLPKAFKSLSGTGNGESNCVDEPKSCITPKILSFTQSKNSAFRPAVPMKMPGFTNETSNENPTLEKKTAKRASSLKCEKWISSNEDTSPRKSFDSTFKPISLNATPQITYPSTASVRSTDASSKMELEQIFHNINGIHTGYEKCVTPGMVGKNKHKLTPFPRQTNKFIDTSVQVIKNSSVIHKQTNKLSQSTVILAENSDNSDCSSFETSGKIINKPDVNVSKRHSSIQAETVSESDSSLLISPVDYGGVSQNLNFTRIANTDANNNTLVDIKNALKSGSPSILPFIKPTKTYLKKQISKPNHLWFSTTANNKKSSNLCQATKKKKLFHLPSNYKESLNSSDSHSSFISQYTPKKNTKRAVKQVPSLYDSLQVDNSPSKEFGGTPKDEQNTTKRAQKAVSEKDLSEPNKVRRSGRKRKLINYREGSDNETGKRALSKNEQSPSRENEKKNTVKKIISKSSLNKNKATVSPNLYQVSQSNDNTSKSDGARENPKNMIKNLILNSTFKEQQNTSVAAKSGMNHVNLTTKPKLNNDNSSNAIRRGSEVVKPPPKLRFKVKVSVPEEESTSKISSNPSSHWDDYEFVDDLTSEPVNKKNVVYKNNNANNKKKVKTGNTGKVEVEIHSTDNEKITGIDSGGNGSTLNSKISDIVEKAPLTQLKSIREGSLRDNEISKTNVTSPIGSLEMKTIQVDAVVHHQNQYAVAIRSKCESESAADAQPITELTAENCKQIVKELCVSCNCSKEKLKDQRKALHSLVQTLKENIDNIKKKVDKLFEVSNNSK